ncbi:copper chaperone PCu(A)C [Prauserella marina]|nr:copper chaperone PCu(A)C [Prauserella marina]
MLGAAAFGLGAALLVTGCGAGQITQTDTQVAAVNGAEAQVGTMAIRNAELAYPSGGEPAVHTEGSNADVLMSIVNQSLEEDQLVSASSENADSVELGGERAIPGNTTLAIGPTAPGGEQQLHGTITLQGLKQEVRPGQNLVITLTFREAGEVQVDLPVMAPTEPRASEEEHEEGGGH